MRPLRKFIKKETKKQKQNKKNNLTYFLSAAWIQIIIINNTALYSFMIFNQKQLDCVEVIMSFKCDDHTTWKVKLDD